MAKEWENIKKIDVKWLISFLFLALLITVNGIRFLPDTLVMELKYSDAATEGTAQIFWAGSEEAFSEEKSSSAQITDGTASLLLGKNAYRAKRCRIDFLNTEQDYGIESISFYVNKELCASINGAGLAGCMQEMENVVSYEVSADTLYVKPLNHDSQAVMNEAFTERMYQCAEAGRGYNQYNVYASILLVLLFIMYLHFSNRLAADSFYYGIVFLMILSILLVAVMSSRSAFNVHPDEFVTKKAIDYYLEHWLPPDIRSSGIADTFSAYGYTRLAELTVYYFAAGKIGYIVKALFGYEYYFRAFNLLLYAAMAAIIAYKGKKERWLVLIAALTPQLWYIFSYATSDAWDYFCSFLLIYQAAAQDSFLNKALNGGYTKKRTFLAYLMFGTLSAFIILGKENYWTVLLLLFVIFLFRLMRLQRSDRNRVMKSYAVILICFSGILALRYSVNIHYYGLNESEISTRVTEERAGHAFKSSTSLEEQYAGLHLHDKGVTWRELFENYHFGTISYKSFTGVFGYMNCYCSDSYYLWMKILYMILIAAVYLAVLWQEQTAGAILETAAVSGLMVFSFVISSLHSWFSDFQPQGRYLLPVIICFAYIASKDKKNLTLGRAWGMALIAAIQLLGMAAYYRYGIVPLT